VTHCIADPVIDDEVLQRLASSRTVGIEKPTATRPDQTDDSTPTHRRRS
jgi:hypothetical protein